MNPRSYASASWPFIAFVYAVTISEFVILSESSYSTSYEDRFMRRLDPSRLHSYQYNGLSSASPSRTYPSQSHLTVTLSLSKLYIRTGFDWIETV